MDFNLNDQNKSYSIVNSIPSDSSRKKKRPDEEYQYTGEKTSESIYQVDDQKFGSIYKRLQDVELSSIDHIQEGDEKVSGQNVLSKRKNSERDCIRESSKLNDMKNIIKGKTKKNSKISGNPKKSTSSEFDQIPASMLTIMSKLIKLRAST